MDILKSFSRIRKHGPYDLLICDPPSLQKGSVDIERDYRKIVRRVPRFMVPGGQLLLCLNSPDLGEEFLLETVAAECPDCRFLERLPAPEVFREAMAGRPESLFAAKALRSRRRIGGLAKLLHGGVAGRVDPRLAEVEGVGIGARRGGATAALPAPLGNPSPRLPP